jgi:hypothetical protein
MRRSSILTARFFTLLLVALSFATMGADCAGDVVRDPTFRDWCGNQLCSWITDAGAIQRVPTWNVNDLGVSFVDQGTQISQQTNETEARCLLFTTVANIDASADMKLLVDFDLDGKIDDVLPLGASQWHKVEIEMTTPAAYDGIGFILRKDGDGTAILAEMRVRSITGCSGPPPSRMDLGLGQACTDDSECESQVCGDGPGVRLCGECSASHPCAFGACETIGVPFAQCAPGQHLGPPGALCIQDSDCQSDACDGATLEPPPGSDAGACALPVLAGKIVVDGGILCTKITHYSLRAGTCR